MCQRDPRYAKDGPDHLLYKIIDATVMNYMPIIEKIDEEIDWIEDQVFDRPSTETLSRLFTLKRVLLAMRRILLPQREVLNKMARDDFKVIDQKDRIFYRDIYDHLVRIQDLTDIIRDIVSGSLDIYLNSTSLRLNEIMKALTIVSTVFLPLSFITGAFGMNFLHIPGASAKAGFYITCLCLALLGTGMLLYFRKRHWF
jgi:magnesium transporter